MKIDRETVEHIGHLARIELSEEEKKMYSRQLSRILDYMEKLSELDTENVEPTSHVVPLSNVFREDRVKPSLPQEVVLENAPDAAQGCFKVPAIIE